MTQFVSAGVYTVERDLSAYVTDLSSTIVGIVGTADKGPTNVPVLITSQKEFVDIFGQVSPKHYLGYAAMSYLKKGNLLWVNRVSATDSKKALSAFVLPADSTPYAGDWTLSGQSASDLTFDLADSATVTGVDKTITLGVGTLLPGFNPTDSTQAVVADGLIGADFGSFVANKSFAIGNYVNITLGAGKGVNATIKDVLGTSSAPKIKVPVSAFPTTNSPASAYAVGSLSLAVPGTWVAPAESTPLMTIATSSALTNNTPVTLTYFQAGTTYNSDVKKDALLATLSAPADDAALFTALETLVLATSGSKYEIGIPLFDPSVVGNNAKNLSLINLVLAGILYGFNKTGVIGKTKLDVLKTDLSVSVAAGLVGFGSVDASGASRGFKAVTTSLNSTGTIVEIHLESLVAGVLGTYKYSTLTPAPVSPLVVKDQVISGSFTSGLSRPKWAMEAAGTAFVPTIVKISSIGEADSSNTAVTLTIDTANKTADKVQNYTLRVYERVVSEAVLSSSTRISDFTLVEQFDGTIEGIQSNVASASRRISMKIDYTTTDTINMTNGIVTLNPLASDGLTFSPVLIASDLGSGVVEGLTYSATATGYDKSFSTFLLDGSIGSPITKDEIIGDAASSTGVYAFSNPEVIDVNVLIAPGWSSDPSVGKVMTSICENRGDAIAVLDTPFGLTVQNVVNYRKSISNINSSYAAMYYPWVKITDTVNKKDIYVPPSGQVVGQYAYNDQVADVYYAPAGRTRGTLSEAIGTERILTQGDRDILAMSQINPIHTEAGYGIYIKGQQTLQSTTTALDRVNVRRLLLKLRKVVATASKAFEFEPGDSTTAYRLKQVAETILEDHLRKGAIQSYTVDVGPNVNTALVRENNELRMEISLVPTKTAERIIEVFSILPQGGGISLA
jgi:phage tail sheath protein FI